MSNLNWPEGATHYLQAGEEQTRFRDLSGEQWKYFNSYTGEWVQHYFSSEDLLRRHDLIARPQPKPWSGPEDGLPPVGTVCEFSDIRVTVITHVDQHDCREEEYKKLAVAQKGNRGQIIMGPARCFKPVSTEEQQAADQRETAIRELMDIAQVDCRVTAARLVDAGFKREVV